MFIMANLLVALAQVLDYLLWAYWWILLGRVIISWVNADPDNPIVRFLYIATEPVLARVRRMVAGLCGWVRSIAHRRLDRSYFLAAFSGSVTL